MTIKKLRWFTSIGILLGLLAAGVWVAARRALRGGVLVMPSKETTIITEPLRKDGYVDYIAALNLILNKDVTPENNVLVPLWNVMGPAEVPRANRAEYFRLLGMEPPPESGNYFVPLKDLRNKGRLQQISPQSTNKDRPRSSGHGRRASSRLWPRGWRPIMRSGNYRRSIASAAILQPPG